MINVIFYSLIGGLLSLTAALVLLNNRKTGDKLALYATPFAAGVLIAAAFTDLLPEALHVSKLEPRTILIWAMVGLLGFFVLERYLQFFHHHHEHGKERSNSALIIIGDTLHNALDGIAIGAAFLIDVPTGVVAAIAVAAHEIPQEIGDFGLLLKNGMKKSKVVLVNVVSALATTLTAVVTFAIGDSDSFPVGPLLAITAGFFIYIAASDIIPSIHEALKKKKNQKQFDARPWLLLAGVGLILVVSPIAHDYIDAAHSDHDHDSHAHSDEGHDAHGDEHKDFVVSALVPQPSVSAVAELDESGLSLQIMTENFTFTPEKEGLAPVSGEGHAHLYINDKKITRIYGEWTFVPEALLPADFSQVTVSLSAHDHSEYHLVDGSAVAATVDVKAHDDEHGHSHDEDEEHGHSDEEEAHTEDEDHMHTEDTELHGDEEAHNETTSDTHSM